jgi:hypothetical protein
MGARQWEIEGEFCTLYAPGNELFGVAEIKAPGSSAAAGRGSEEENLSLSFTQSSNL